MLYVDILVLKSSKCVLLELIKHLHYLGCICLIVFIIILFFCIFPLEMQYGFFLMQDTAMSHKHYFLSMMVFIRKLTDFWLHAALCGIAV